MVVMDDGAGCRVQGAGCRVKGAGCRVQGAGSHLKEGAREDLVVDMCVSISVGPSEYS